MQDPFTMLHLLRRIGKQLADGIRDRGGRAERRRIEADRLAEVGLGAEIADRYPHQLSGACASARDRRRLARDPDLLIADEPTTAPT
ncbi:MAG: hypothetical protein R2697_00600 [Ilumatobacteraceae bacterium]